ncbi:hypothetical protein KY330_04730 [Candidatus Woesearchaeota archaeon]|nr:hypothetical protein [Candidatus Woesearchaeota archaeon]
MLIDLDKDGLLDYLVKKDEQIIWYRNTGQRYEKHVLGSIKSKIYL